MNQPCDQELKPQEIITILLLLVNFGLLGWNIHSFNKLLPLSQSNVIFSGSEISVVSTTCLFKSVFDDNYKRKGCDVLQPKIVNIGKARADDIKFIIYSVWINESDLVPLEIKEQLGDEDLKKKMCDDSNYKDILYPMKEFDNGLVQNLEPGVGEYFGRIDLPYNSEMKIEAYDKNTGQKTKEKTFNIDFIGKQKALIYYLKYKDSINKKDPYEYRIFLFQHTIGGLVNSLLDEDFRKIYSRLKEKLEDDLNQEQNENKKNDIKNILEFIEDKYNNLD